MKVIFAIPNDSEIEIILDFIRQLYENEHIVFDKPMLHTSLEKMMKDDSLGKVWLICDEGEAVGYCLLTFGYSLEFHGRDALLDEFYIKESYRSKGIGQETIKFLEGVCRELGVDALHVHVDKKNIKAQALYDKIGFKALDRILMTKWIKKC